MKSFNIIDWVAFILVVVGAVNWGLVGLFGINVVSMLFGDMTMIARVVYVVVGVAGIYVIVSSVRYGRKE